MPPQRTVRNAFSLRSMLLALVSISVLIIGTITGAGLAA